MPTVKQRKKQKSLSRALLVSLGIPTVFVPGLILASILGWDWQNDLAKVTQMGGYKQSRVIFPKEATITNVFDGDTVELDNGQTVRMIGIDAPDRGGRDFEGAKEYLSDVILNENVRLEYDYYTPITQVRNF